MITIEIAWSRANLLSGEPALSVMSRIEKDGQLVDMTEHVIPLADLQSFIPPLSIWHLIEVACAPAAEAQERRDRATAAAIAKRARKAAGAAERMSRLQTKRREASRLLSLPDDPMARDGMRRILDRIEQDERLADLAGVDTLH